jgi:hypothetical protein
MFRWPAPELLPGGLCCIFGTVPAARNDVRKSDEVAVMGSNQTREDGLVPQGDQHGKRIRQGRIDRSVHVSQMNDGAKSFQSQGVSTIRVILL